MKNALLNCSLETDRMKNSGCDSTIRTNFEKCLKTRGELQNCAHIEAEFCRLR